MIFQIQSYYFVLPLLLSTNKREPNPTFYGSLKQETDTSQLPHRPLGTLQETVECDKLQEGRSQNA